MSNERDQGFAALQRGDYAGAATLLEAACRQDPNDFHSHLYLGGAYHQLRRSEDAVRLLTRAAELQPANPQARYNLGIALAQANRHAEAVASLQQALALKPDYGAAQQELQRLLSVSQAVEPAPTYGAVTQQFPAAAPLGGYGARPLNAPEAGAPPTAPGSAPLYGGPTAAQGGYGQPTLQGAPPLYGGQPGYGQPPATPGYGGYAPPGTRGAGSYGHTAPGGQYAPNYGYQDGFSIGDAFNDLLQILMSPSVFFEGQAGCEGILAPAAMALLYVLAIGVGTVALFFVLGSRLGLAGMIGLFVLPFGLGIGYLLMLLGYLIGGGVVHLVGMMFGNRAPFSGSFRAVVYAYAPSALLGAVLLLLMAPMMSGKTVGTMPQEVVLLSWAGNAIAVLWSAVLLVMGVRSIQRLSLGASVGVVVICGALVFAFRLVMNSMFGH